MSKHSPTCGCGECVGIEVDHEAMRNDLLAERDSIAAELFDAQHLIGILLDRLGGEVTLTDDGVVAVPRGRTITTLRNDHDFRVIVRVGP